MRVEVLGIDCCPARPAIEELHLCGHARLALVDGLRAAIDARAALRVIADRIVGHERHECHERDETRQPHTSCSGGERRSADFERSAEGTTLGRLESFPVVA